MTRDLDALPDSELITRVRDGDSPAYGVLWKRHWPAARAMAASVTARFEPEDLASEAFLRILRAVEKGHGPRTGFRSYLATTVRNVAIDWSRRKAVSNIEDPDAIHDWTYSEVTAHNRFDCEIVTAAFQSLPDSWQEVLWYTEVENMAPRDLAPLLGLSPNAVAARAARAREGLRQAWIDAHIAKCDAADPAHAWVLKRLGGYVRNKLSRTERDRVRDHLEACVPCTSAADEAHHVGSRLALAILPLFLGVAGATAYSAFAQGSGSAVAATLPPGAALSAGSHLARRGGKLRRLLNSGSAGVTTGAGTAALAVTAAAALTAGALLSTPADDVGASANGSETPSASRQMDARAASDSTLAPLPQDGSVDEVDEADPADRKAEPPRDTTAPAADATAPAEAVAPPVRPAEEAPVPEGCEAAVRSIPAESTLFAYRLDDSPDAESAVDFIHQRTANYHGAADSRGTGSNLSTENELGRYLTDTTLRSPSHEFTVQIRFKTSVGGGRLIGFGIEQTGVSSYFDRHLFLTDDGRLVFGVFPEAVRTIGSTATYTDGRWHHATASLSADGMSLYVDGERVAHDTSVTSAQEYSGYWRVGGDNLNAWGRDTPIMRHFDGELAYAAVYSGALTAEQIRAQSAMCR